MAQDPDVFDYLDHRAFLRAWFEARKAVNPRFSHRAFLRRAGQKSPSLLLHVMRGDRNLTEATTEGFLVALGLDPQRAAYFRALVALDAAKTDEARNQAFERISAARRVRDARRIEDASFRYLSTWYFPAIRELAACEGFRADPAWIARQLRPPISTAAAREALAMLRETGLLRDDADGLPRPSEASIVTPTEVAGLAVHNYHREMSERAREAIDGVPAGERHLLGVTVAIPAALVPRLKDELNALQARLLDLCDGSPGPRDRVYQLNLQLVPLSRPVES